MFTTAFALHMSDVAVQFRRELGTGKNCVRAADADGGPKCTSSQIALCCDTSKTSQNCGAASGRACKDRFSYARSGFAPYCCDQMDMPGCVNLDSPKYSTTTCTVGAPLLLLQACNENSLMSMHSSQ